MRKGLRRQWSGLRAMFKKIIKKVALFSNATGILKAFNRDKAAILMYHNLCSNYQEAHRNLAISADDFERHIRHVKRFYNVISLSALVQAIRDKKQFPDFSVVITFDDGYRNNFTLAYPILKKYQVPVTVFLTTGLIGTNHYLWFNELECAISQTLEQKIDVFINGHRLEFLLKDRKYRSQAYTSIKELLKNLENKTLNSVLHNIFDQLKYKNVPLNGNYAMLNWREIKAMNGNVIDFGAHTRTHASLPFLEENKAYDEISGSKKDLEKELNREVTSFCYPYGRYDNKIKQIVKNHYSAAVSTSIGFVDLNSDLYELPRIWTPLKLADFAWNIARPS